MKFTLFTFLLALIGATLTGGLIGYLFRKFFIKEDNQNRSAEEGIQASIQYFKKKEAIRWRGSLILLLSVGFALIAQPVACKIGINLNPFNLSPDHQFFMLVTGGVLILTGLLYLAKNR